MTTATKKLVSAYAQLNEEDRQTFLAQIADVDTEIVAYTISGKPLNRQEYIAKIDDARKQVREGKTITRKDLLSKIEAW